MCEAANPTARHALVPLKIPFNQYGVVTIDPQHCPRLKRAAADRFVDWLLGPRGQAAIAAFRVDDQQLFFPNAD